MNCEYCNKIFPNYRKFPLEGKYSGIEARFLDNKGLLRIRAFDVNDMLEAQDVVYLNYCPMCGRKLHNAKNKEN